MDDPFAVLGLKPDATASAVRAAYRRQAKRLHPDVAGAGSADAFSRLRRAYEAARAIRATPSMPSVAPAAAPEPTDPLEPGPEHIGAWAVRHAAREQPGWEAAVEPEPGPKPRFRRGLRTASVALGTAAIVAGGFHVLHRPPGPAFVTALPPAALPVQQSLIAPEPAPHEATGQPFYVRPGTAPATLFRYDPDARRYRPDGQLPAFAVVRVLRTIPASGMAELRATGSSRGGYMLADALESGDARAAQTSRCVYGAGQPPQNGEVLGSDPPVEAPPSGRARMVQNAGDLPAVFGLRDTDGHQVVSVFVAPHSIAELPPLPPGPYRAEYASGDLWSRACARFIAAARSARAPLAAALADRYVLPLPNVADATDGDLD